MSPPRLKIANSVIDRISRVKNDSSGSLFGVMYDNTLLVLGFNIEIKLENASALDIQAWSADAHVVHNLPTEVDVCGIITIGEDVSSEETKENVIKMLEEVDITDNPLLLSLPTRGSKDIKTHFYLHEKLLEKSFEVVNEDDIWKEFVHVRLQGRLPLVSELDENELRETLKTMYKKVAAGMLSFCFPKINVYLMGNDLVSGLSGLSIEPTVGELWDLYSGSKNAEFLSEGCNMKVQKKKNSKSAREIDVLPVNLLMKPTSEIRSESQAKSAPVIQHIKKKYDCIKMALRVDAIAMVSRKTKISNLYAMLVESACRNIKLNDSCLGQQMAHDEGEADNSKVVPSIPEPFHFLPPNFSHFFTVMYPKGYNENKLISTREALHKMFALPLDRPVFRRGNAHLFQEDIPANAPLINPHEGLNPSGVKGGDVSIVQGLYSYHHYMQDKMDDDGWGCAYRSLQTLVSWFRWQGYTQHPIPTHREIQQCLVKLKDKPSSFIGSSQWIGSTEVYMCLESLLGITCKIMSVSSGEELSSKGGELAMHFEMEGTPIMIGGGVLAHTILGVDFNRLTGDLKFLILDPHYTGGEDIGIIQGKGWCGWKGPNFWAKNAFYNLCMPLRPRGI